MFWEKESCWLEKLAPYSCHGYPALVWPAIVNVLTWWKNVIGLWINHQRSNIFVLCCGNQLDHRYKIGQEFPQIRYFASLTWKRFGSLHVQSLVLVPPTFLKASNLADQESVWGQRRLGGASIIDWICDIPVDMVEHVFLAFHWHRFVCFGSTNIWYNFTEIRQNIWRTVTMEFICQLMAQINSSIGELITFERNSHSNNWHYFTWFMLHLATK